MMLLVLVSVIVVLISAWYAYYFKYDRYLKQYKGPTPLPLLGHALYFKSLQDYLTKQLELHKQYDLTVKLHIGFFPPFLQISNPKLLEILLGSTKILDKSEDYEYLDRWLGTGLLTTKAQKWKKHRKILTPAFHFQILEQFISTFTLYSDILVDKLEKEVGKLSFDIYPYITLCSLDIICATAMGTAVNAQKDGTFEYVKNVQTMTRLVMERMVSFLPNFLYVFTSNKRAEAKCVKILHEYTKTVIATRKQELENEQDTKQNHENDLGIKQKKSFLDLLLQYKVDGGAITDEEIREEVDTFMFAGHDTTAAAITFTLFCLANNPEVQKKSIEELNAIFDNDPNRPANSKDLHEMKYLEMVIKESMRLYPPVPMYGRNLSEDTEFNRSVLPKNLSLGVFAFGVHRNPDIYPDPEKFDPERFTPENQARRSLYAYVPFSAGSRNCIGQRFAMLELKAVVSKVLRTYELFPAQPEHRLDLVPELVLKSSSGVRIRIEKRSLN